MADDTPPPPPNTQNIGVQMGEGSAVGGDVTGGDKIVAGGHVIQAAAGATVIIGGATPGQVGEGLNALTDLVQRSPELRAAVVGFRTDFQAASEQIDLLSDYKDLHDILHRLQFQCYNGIQQIESRFPADEMALNTVADSQVTLEGIIGELQSFGSRASAAKQELTWMQDMLDAQKDLQSAVDSSDPKALRNTIRRLNRLLSTQPAKINNRLTSAARALRLASLTQALGSILGNVQSLDFDAEKKKQFESGVSGLTTLSQTLTVLIDSHDAWQDMDVELRRIELELERNVELEDFEMYWDDLKRKSESLYKEAAEDWAVGIRKDADGIDKGLAAKNPAAAKTSFKRFRRRASDRFFRIDVDLKSLCGELRLVGQPLASVLRMIE